MCARRKQGGDLRLIPTTDQKILQEILFDAELWERVSEDGRKRPDKINTNNGMWFTAIADTGETVGVVWLHSVNQATMEVHINILEQYRRQHAFSVGRRILENFCMFCGWGTINKLICHIPAYHIDVCKFTEKFGFIHEGTRTEAFLKHGKYHDVICYGLTKKQAEEWLTNNKEQQ
jgi:RimJ/RimL family protein N-acetyltransferase